MECTHSLGQSGNYETAEKTALMAPELSRYKIDIVAFSEIRFANEGTICEPERVYEDLDAIVMSNPANCKLILLSWVRVMGAQEHKTMNNNGLLLLTMCAEIHLTINRKLFRMAKNIGQYKCNLGLRNIIS